MAVGFRFNIALWWVKRDARLDDNPSLTAGLAAARHLIPVAIDEPLLWSAPESSDLHRRSWLDAVRALQGNLQHHGSRLLFLQGSAEECFSKLFQKLPVEAVFSHEEIGSELTFKRDRLLKEFFASRAVVWQEFPQCGVVRGLKDRGRREPLWRERVASLPLPIPDRLSMAEGIVQRIADVAGPVPSVGNESTVTERRAHQTLRSFLETRSASYRGSISSPNTALYAGSRLSEHLAWGTISTRRVYFESNTRIAQLRVEGAGRWARSLQAFQSRIHWRDHFMQRLESEPGMEFTPLHSGYDSVPYEDDPGHLQAWLRGETGELLVDACMRCLQHTGFINFRMRAMVVSYACHVLHLSWRTIMYPLARLFVDYEPGIHISQLQMQAGVVGINTVRIYNPRKQLVDQDPRAEFVKRWIPELAGRKADELLEYGTTPLSSYLAPIVSYEERSRSMRELLYGIKSKSRGSKVTVAVLTRHGSRRPAQKRAGQKKRGKPISRQLSLLIDS